MHQMLTDPLIPLVSFLLGLLVGHRLALWRDRLDRRHHARAAFRAALLPALRALERDDDRFDPLGPHFEGHALAVLTLAPYLPRRPRRRLAEQWQRYQQWYQQAWCPELPDGLPGLVPIAADHLRRLLALAPEV